MKQLSSSELNSMSKEELAVMVLKMQQLQKQMQKMQDLLIVSILMQETSLLKQQFFHLLLMQYG